MPLNREQLWTCSLFTACFEVHGVFRIDNPRHEQRGIMTSPPRFTPARWQLDYRRLPCNLVELMPRLLELYFLKHGTKRFSFF
jgi:hypothetical protein